MVILIGDRGEKKEIIKLYFGIILILSVVFLVSNIFYLF